MFWGLLAILLILSTLGTVPAYSRLAHGWRCSTALVLGSLAAASMAPVLLLGRMFYLSSMKTGNPDTEQALIAVVVLIEGTGVAAALVSLALCLKYRSGNCWLAGGALFANSAITIMAVLGFIVYLGMRAAAV